MLAILASALITVACGGEGANGDGADGINGGSNLIENTGGEQNADGYIGHNGATVSQDTTTASEGVASIRAAVPNVQGSGVQIWKVDGVTMTAVTSGSTYALSLDVMGDVGKSARLELLWHRADGSFLITTLGEVFFLPLGSFQTFTFTSEAPEDAALVVPQIVTDVAPGGPVTMWIDNARLEEISSAAPPAEVGTPEP